MKLAWFTPFSRRSAIGQFSAIIVEELMRAAEVVVYAPDVLAANASWLPAATVRPLSESAMDSVVAELASYDGIVYNLGNHAGFHGAIYQVARRQPGIIILHDLVMHHFFSAHLLAERGDREGYLHALEYAHGLPGRVLGQSVVDGRAGMIWHTPTMLEFHMARAATRGCLHIVVHSAFAQRALDAVADAPVSLFAFPAPESGSTIGAPSTAGTDADERADGRLRLLTYGMVNPNKMIREIIEAIAASSILRRRVLFQVAGDSSHDLSHREALERLIRERAVGNCVELLGYQTEAALHRLIEASDVIVNIRNPHYGEASWVLLEAAFAAKATIVWKHGSYDEFPDATVVKVDSLTALRAALERLCQDDDWRAQLGRQLRAYAQATFVTAAYARHLLDLIDRVQYDRPVLALTDLVGEVLVELGVDTTMPDIVKPIADEIALLVQPREESAEAARP